MDRAKFFAALRKRNSGVFGTSLSQAQVDGMEAILDSCIRNRVTDAHHVAQILSNVYRETGKYMMPIKETVYESHKDKNPSDATVIARLDRAWAKGQLTWVTTPYWRDGAFGRGQLQITHWPNYERLGRRLGLPLRSNPDLALDPKVSSDIAVVGMAEGLFTGKKLSDYKFPEALRAASSKHPRRIVNGKDGTDAKIAAYHCAFHSALITAGWTGEREIPAPKPNPPQKPVEPPKRPGGPVPPKTPETPPPSKSGGNSGKWAAGVIAALLGAGAVFLERVQSFFGGLF
jgi:hypothetical protein